MSPDSNEYKSFIDEAFEMFINDQKTKLLLSLVPPAQPPELVQTLLRAAFDSGAATSLVHVLKKSLEGRS